MFPIQNIKQKSIARNAMIILTAIALSAAVVTDAVAAGRGLGGEGHAGGHIGGGFRGPLPDRVPSMSPIFNPSSPYTVAPSGETPVSPASPGSVFGNS